jgi:hypothetical protein
MEGGSQMTYETWGSATGAQRTAGERMFICMFTAFNEDTIKKTSRHELHPPRPTRSESSIGYHSRDFHDIFHLWLGASIGLLRIGQ